MYQNTAAYFSVSLLIATLPCAASGSIARGQSPDAVSSPSVSYKSKGRPNEGGSQRSKDREKSRTPRENEGTARRRALELLSQVLERAQGFQEDRRLKGLNRFLIQTQIAEMLWSYDEPRARRLFIDTFNAADSLRVDSLSHEMRIHLRNDVLVYLTGHDKALAEKLATSVGNRKSVLEAGNANSDQYALEEQTTLILQMAISVAASEPEHAAELITSSLNGRFGYKHIEALKSLRRGSPALADGLFLHVASSALADSNHLRGKICLLATYLFPIIQNEIKASGNTADVVEPVPQVDPVLARMFLNMVHETFMQRPLEVLASKETESGGFAIPYQTLSELLPYFDQYLPDKSKAIRERFADVIAEIRRTNAQGLAEQMAEETTKALSISEQELLDKAEAADSERMRGKYYAQVAMLALMRDQDFDRALSIASTIGNEEDRRGAILFLTIIASSMALEKGDTDRAYQYSKDLPVSIERAGLLIGVANSLAAKGKNEKAGALLMEVKDQLLNEIDDSKDKVRALILLADVAVSTDPEMAFQAMKLAVECDNRIGPAFEMDGYDLTSGRLVAVAISRFDRNQTFSWLARVDFDRSLSLARLILDREASTVAEMAICRGILTKSISPRPLAEPNIFR